MKNSEYWEKRIANSTWKTYNSLEEKNKALLEMYQEASLSISDELYRVAEKMKTGTPTLSDMHKFNRLTGLQKNMENIIRELGEDVEKFANKNIQDGIQDAYKNVMVGLGATEFDRVPSEVMEQMMRTPWQGNTFSKRLWKNTQVLASNLNDILVNGLTQGKTVTEMAIQLNNAMNTGFNVCHRLVRTETMHYLNESSKRAYKDGGCEEVQYWAAKDERTCEICGAKHEKVYKVDKAPVLPLHPMCRCTFLPIVQDNKKDKQEFEKLQNIKPPLAKRHRFESIGKKSIAKDKNTIILPGVDYIKDIEDIKAGMYNKIKDTYEVNGRIYGYHGDRFYPIKGDGVVILNRDQYKLLKELKINPNNPYMDNIKKGLKLSDTQEKEVYELLKLLRKE